MKDRYERVIDYLRISIIDRCNLRCVYCMPQGGVAPLSHKSILTYEELIRIVRIAVSLGVKKVRITGGEPLIRKNLPYLVSSLRGLGGIEDLSITTNGLLLKQNAAVLARAGLHRVNVSLDSLKPERFSAITRGGNLHDVLGGIEEADRQGLHPIKLNMVPIRGLNDDEIEDFARLTTITPYHVRFIEFMPIGATEYWTRDRYISSDEIRRRVEALGPLAPVRVRKSGPARYYRLADSPGVIGFISAVTHHFCESCNRLRLTSDGKLRPCLFSETEIDLKSALRSGSTDQEIERLLRLSVQMKPEKHGIPSGHCFAYLKPLSKIGG